MKKDHAQECQQQLDTIVKDYLYKISVLQNHNHFKKYKITDSREKYYLCHGFGIFNDETENDYVVKEELFLEGCTRVFLINPIMKYLLNRHGIENEWQYGSTFANFSIANREYELSHFLEFIAVLNEKKIGVRYTKSEYSMEESYVMERDSAFTIRKESIPGYDKLRSIDFLYSIDWSGLAEEELSKIHSPVAGMTSFSRDISIKKFFEKYFSTEEYDIMLHSVKKAIKSAKEIIALKAVPQLLPNNILQFKLTVLEDFSLERMKKLSYDFQNKRDIKIEREADLRIIENNFFKLERRKALIGSADFAKSFITSEYLFRTVREGLSIDYTSIVVGYLKSVEQLLYLLYVSAFKGDAGMSYWDECNKRRSFDPDKPLQYRFDPYGSKCKQEKYWHRKKSGRKAPDISELNRFLRYFNEMWLISESDKEYVCKCLDDFRCYCRNAHFHKNNIEFSEYDMVKRIRNNTHVCLYYLLGGFELMNESIDKTKQLGIIDFGFEMMHQKIRQRGCRLIEAEFKDGSRSILYYLNKDEKIEYDEAGKIKDGCMKFLKIDIDKEDMYIDEVLQLAEDKEYVSNHTLCVTANNMPLDAKHIYLKRR